MRETIKMVSFSNIYAFLTKQIHKMHKITPVEDGETKILRQKVRSLGINLGLGYLGPAGYNSRISPMAVSGHIGPT